MTDPEKVIKGLKCCVSDEHFECPYRDRDNNNGMLKCWNELMQDALGLLEEIKPKKRESLAMLPCKCGGKRREHWFSPDREKPEGLKCSKCGFEVWGKNARDAIREWNKAVKQNV